MKNITLKTFYLESGVCGPGQECKVTDKELNLLNRQGLTKESVEKKKVFIDEVKAEFGAPVPDNKLEDEFGFMKGHPNWNDYTNTEKGRINKLRNNARP